MLSGPGSSVNLGLNQRDLGRGERVDGVLADGATLDGTIAAAPGRSAGLDAAGLAFPASSRADGSLPQLVPGAAPSAAAGADASSQSAEALIGIDEVQKALNRSRASVYRYTNTDPRNLNPPFNPRRLNPEYRSDQKDPLLFHPNEVARFARDVLRIKEVTVEVLNSPSTATQQLLGSILDELRAIRQRLDRLDPQPALRHETASRFDQQSRPAA